MKFIKNKMYYDMGENMRKPIFILIGIILLISNASALSWSGYDWTLKSGIKGPGSNYWNPNNAYVDSDGKLHLEINYTDDHWNCVELDSVKKFKYGTYTWVVSSQSLNLDKNVVLGLFTYTDDNHEIDIESGQWGNSSSDHLHFTCQPDQTVTFVSPTSNYVNATDVTYTFDWQPSYIHYTARASDGKTIANWYCTDTKDIPKVKAKVMINLWLQHSIPPSNGEPVEVIISSFHASPGKHKISHRHVPEHR
jgi:hypothetical protein